jgi:hypothetical protein
MRKGAVGGTRARPSSLANSFDTGTEYSAQRPRVHFDLRAEEAGVCPFSRVSIHSTLRRDTHRGECAAPQAPCQSTDINCDFVTDMASCIRNGRLATAGRRVASMIDTNKKAAGGGNAY